MATFSISMWNEQLSLQLAREIKSRWPDCLVVFGGAQCPHDSRSYLEHHDFVDVAFAPKAKMRSLGFASALLNPATFPAYPM